MDFLSFESVTYENDPVYGPIYIIEPEEWIEKYKKYKKYQIIESNYGYEECHAAEFIQSWWRAKHQK